MKVRYKSIPWIYLVWKQLSFIGFSISKSIMLSHFYENELIVEPMDPNRFSLIENSTINIYARIEYLSFWSAYFFLFLFINRLNENINYYFSNGLFMYCPFVIPWTNENMETEKSNLKMKFLPLIIDRFFGDFRNSNLFPILNLKHSLEIILVSLKAEMSSRRDFNDDKTFTPMHDHVPRCEFDYSKSEKARNETDIIEITLNPKKGYWIYHYLFMRRDCVTVCNPLLVPCLVYVSFEFFDLESKKMNAWNHLNRLE